MNLSDVEHSNRGKFIIRSKTECVPATTNSRFKNVTKGLLQKDKDLKSIWIKIFLEKHC